MHEAGRITPRRLDVALLQGRLPVGERRNEKRIARAAAPRLAVPTVVRQQWKIKHGIAPSFIVVRQILEHIALDLANVPIRIDHLPVRHVFSRASFNVLGRDELRLSDFLVLDPPSSIFYRRPYPSAIISPKRPQNSPMAP